MKRIVVALLVSLNAWAEHSENNSSTNRPVNSAHSSEVGKVLSKKCLTCHGGDRWFDENGIPLPEARAKVLDAIRGKPGTKPMPPASKEQLTPDELALINRWSGDGEADSSQDVCQSKENERNPEVMKGIFSDRCVTCHGKLSLNPTSVLRGSHTQFLKNDGKLDPNVLGDISEVAAYNIPEGKTSIGRILDSLTNYAMPPRGNLPVINTPSSNLFPEVGTPHMTDAERQYLIRALNRLQKRNNCPVKNMVSMIFSRSQKPVIEKFADAASDCEKHGKRIPTRKQLEKNMGTARNLFKGEGCIWTTTFGEEIGGSVKKPKRKALDLSDANKASFLLKKESEKCSVVCID